ncbi:hypothetical protein ACQKNB_01335 [Lysinibacillus xylanilyticus]|uniref:hypothetical protein n=1 Tax=Lysinibacillus xylanilyticus TaxID=582475 RepID=UPI003D053BC5
MGISDRGTKAKTITSCDNAFVTNILLLSLRFRAKNICCPETLERANRGTKAKSITSCDNAFVTYIV